MKHKLIIPLIILLLTTFNALNAQTKKEFQKKKNVVSLDSVFFKKLTNRLEIGYNNPAQWGLSTNTTYFNGVKIGLTTDFQLSKNMSLLTGVLYNLAYSDKLQMNPSSINYLTYGHFINIPVQFFYNLPVSNNFKFFGFAGPALNIGLSQFQGTMSTVSTIKTTYTDLYKSNLNQLDLQISVGGGLQWNKYQLKAGYDYGLLNINRLSTGNIYQKGWYISLAVTL